MEGEAIVVTALAFVAGVVWAVRIEGKVLAHEREIAQLRQDTDQKIDRVLTEVAYIRERIDRALEFRP
jgi:hypothetical protein